MNVGGGDGAGKISDNRRSSLGDHKERFGGNRVADVDAEIQVEFSGSGPPDGCRSAGVDQFSKGPIKVGLQGKSACGCRLLENFKSNHLIFK